MPVISGKTGCVNGISCVRQWTITHTSSPADVVDSATKGAKGAVAGNQDWSGSYVANGAIPEVRPGETFDFQAAVDATNGVSGTAIVDRIEIEIDVENGGIISHTVSFSGNGVLTYGAVTASDAGPPKILPAMNCHVTTCAPAQSPTWTALTNVRTIRITLSADNQTYVDSSCGGWTQRVGGNITAEISISVYMVSIEDLLTIVEPNNVRGVRIYVNADTYWELLWMMFTGLSNVTVDIERGTVVGADLAARFVVSQQIGGNTIYGTIKAPGNATWWPA